MSESKAKMQYDEAEKLSQWWLFSHSTTFCFHPSRRILFFLSAHHLRINSEGGGCSLNFNPKGVCAYIWDPKQHSGPVTNNIGHNSTFGLHKSEERRNRAFWCDSLQSAIK